jgi:hypothetical protein
VSSTTEGGAVFSALERIIRADGHLQPAARRFVVERRAVVYPPVDQEVVMPAPWFAPRLHAVMAAWTVIPTLMYQKTLYVKVMFAPEGSVCVQTPSKSVVEQLAGVVPPPWVHAARYCAKYWSRDVVGRPAQL